jgi:hypothetical protein
MARRHKGTKLTKESGVWAATPKAYLFQASLANRIDDALGVDYASNSRTRLP